MEKDNEQNKKKLVKVFLAFGSNLCILFHKFRLELNSEIEQL